MPDLEDLFDGSIGAWDAVLAVLILLASWVFWRITRRNCYRLLKRVDGLSEHLRLLAARIAGYAVLLLGIGVALSVLGARLQPLLAVALLVGVVLVLALKGIADNFAASVVIQTRQPIRLGDEIEAAGFLGRVTELNGRSVIIETRDGRRVHIPNSTVLSDPIVNRSAGGILRSDVEVRTTGAVHLPEMMALMVAAAREAAGVRDDPGPYVRILALEPDRITALVRFWHDWPDTRKVTSAVISSIAARLRDAGRTATVTGPPPASPPQPPRTPPAPI